MANNKAESLLVITASLLNCTVQRGCVHLHSIGSRSCTCCGNIVSMFTYKSSIGSLNITSAGCLHSKNAFQDSKNRVLIPVIPITGNLISDICHEINTASHIIAEICFRPAHHATIGENTLFKGISATGGKIVHAVIVLCIPANQSKIGNDPINSTSLTGIQEKITQTLIRDNRSGFPKLIQLYIRNGGHVLSKSLFIKAFCIKFCHCLSILSLR